MKESNGETSFTLRKSMSFFVQYAKYIRGYVSEVLSSWRMGCFNFVWLWSIYIHPFYFLYTDMLRRLITFHQRNLTYTLAIYLHYYFYHLLAINELLRVNHLFTILPYRNNTIVTWTRRWIWILRMVYLYHFDNNVLSTRVVKLRN